MELITSLLTGAGGAAFFAGVFGLIQWALNRKAQKNDHATEEKVSTCTARGEEIRALSTSVENLITADRVLLYDRIKHLAKSYIKKEYITIEDYEDLKTMHSVYHTELKGNGFLDSLMAQVDKLEKRV